MNDPEKNKRSPLAGPKTPDDYIPPRRGKYSQANVDDMPPRRPRASQESDEAEAGEYPRWCKPIEPDPDELPRRGRPAQRSDDSDTVEYPKRGKPVREQMPPDDDGSDLPPRRPARVPDQDDLPPRRGRTSRDAAEAVDYPRRSQPATNPSPPRRREQPVDDGGDLPPRRPARVPDPDPQRGRPLAAEHAKVLPSIGFDASLMPLKELRDLAVTAYNTFHNSSRRQEVELILFKIKHALADWARWQETLNDGQKSA